MQNPIGMSDSGLMLIGTWMTNTVLKFAENGKLGGNTSILDDKDIIQTGLDRLDLIP